MKKRKVKGIMLSIRDDLARQIFCGSKEWEVRKAFLPNHAHFYVYACAPTKKVIGEFYCRHVIGGSPKYVWDETDAEHGALGITRCEFDNYFKGKSRGSAYHVSKKRKYGTPKDLQDFGIKRAPQSWCYVYEEEKE